jgi:DNA-binding transcriptional LysR family regulator
MKDERLLEMRIFRAVVEAGSFTAGANALGVSQSFVSRSLIQLETRLGLSLLHRSTRGIRLTEEGGRYLISAGKILASLDEIEGNLSHAKTSPVGDLRLSVPIAFGTDQIVPRIPQFLRDHPQIKLHLSLTDTIVSLIDDNIDLAIRMGRLRDSTLVNKKLCDLRRIVVASPVYLEKFGEPLTPADLVHHNCLEWQGDHEHLNHWPFKGNSMPETILAHGNFRSSNGLSMFEICLEGVGIMRLAEHLAVPAIRAGRLVRLLPDVEVQDQTAIHALYRPERHLLPRIRSFVDYFVDIFRKPPWLHN